MAVFGVKVGSRLWMKDTFENQCRSSVCDVSKFGTGNKGKAFEKTPFVYSSITCSSLFYAVEIELSWIVCMSSILWMELVTFSQRFYWPSSIGSGATAFGARILDTKKKPELGDVQKCQVFFLRFFCRKTMAVKILHWSFMTWMIYLG